MRTARILVVASALLITACSSSDDASPQDSAADRDTETSVPSSEDIADGDAPTTDAPTTEAPTTDAPTTDAAVDVTVATDPADPADPGDGDTTDRPLVIDGPAEVRPSCASLPRGVSEFTLDAGGGVHDVRLYVPESVSVDPAPTVLNWHGLGSSGVEQAALSGYEALAETEGFIRRASPRGSRSAG